MEKDTPTGYLQSDYINEKKSENFFIAALFSLFFILAISTQVEPAKAIPAEISVEPSYQRIVAGEAFTINITVDPKGNEVMGLVISCTSITRY